jgi:uncharacterized membrane protein (UPF0136 family)
MDHKQQGQLIGYAVGGLIFLVIFGFRMRRMMQSRPFNLQNVWILPAIFIALTGLTLWSQPPQGRDWIWIGLSALIGAGLGWFRAKTIRLTLDPATRQVMAQGSPLAMAFILVIFAVRFGLRSVMQAESSTLGISLAVVDGAFLAMACGLFVARSLEMGVRANKLLLQGPDAAPAG